METLELEGPDQDQMMTLVLDRPGQLNSLDGTMVRELEEALTTVAADPRSEEHTSELQSQAYLVCRLLLEKKKKKKKHEAREHATKHTKQQYNGTARQYHYHGHC